MTLQEAERIMKQLNCWHKCYYAFRTYKKYKLRGWQTRAWFTMLKGNKL